jgi:hypothetical protein
VAGANKISNTQLAHYLKFRVGIAAAIGFLLPVFFGFVAVLLFSPRASNFWRTAVLRIPYLLCPVLLLTDISSTWWYLSPLTNATLYGLIAYLWIRVRKAYSN